nr:uncharacterized protein LOC127339785 [Lolium perenne]
MDASWPWPARPRSGSDRARAPPPAGAPPPPLDGTPRSLPVPHRRAEAPYRPLLHHAASQPRDPRDVASPREEAPSGCATHAALRLRRPGAATAAGGGGGKGGRRAGVVSRVWLSPPESPARATREAAVLKISLLLNFLFYTEELCLCRDEGKASDPGGSGPQDFSAT